MSKSIALAAALLPGMGVFIRYVALLLLEGSPNTWNIAWSAPLAALIATGFLGALFGSGYPLLYFFLRRTALGYHISFRMSALKNRQKDVGEEFDSLAARVHDSVERFGGDEPALTETVEALRETTEALRRTQQRNEEIRRDLEEVEPLIREEERRLGPKAERSSWIPPNWVLTLTLVLLALAATLFLPYWPILVAGVLASLIVHMFFLRAARKSPNLRFVDLWPAILLVAFIFSIAAGLVGNLPGTGYATYRFASGTPGVEDGEAYVELGITDSVTYLFDCRDGSIVGVPHASVQGIEFESRLPESSLDRLPPNLWSVLIDGAEPRLGFSAYCP